MMHEGLDRKERNVGGSRTSSWEKIPLPLKFFLGFAIASYAIQMYLTYSHAVGPAPGTTASFVVAWTICPLCILMPTVDPTPSSMMYFIGPINAVIHGVIGAMVGYVIEAFF
jgi:hypothetical protein